MKRINFASIIGLLFLGSLASSSFAQTYSHGRSSSYVSPKDPKVLEKLDSWQDLKFGMLIHFGLYTQLGIVESWSICGEDEEWIPRDTINTYEEYKRSYWATINSFRPKHLNPEVWSKVGKNAGMKYVVFTTKHHDGFNMFDTKYSKFSITQGAFKDDPKKNVAKEVFDAFRKDGYMIGAYYSKPDWHSPYYWWDKYPTANRNNNYKIKNHPERWNKFKDFCYNQIEELMGGEYGQMDILWLDGGWVRPAVPGQAERMGAAFTGSQDIDMPKIAQMARKHQPGLLIVDRTVPGEFENYQTPERGIPEEQLTNPWESCMPLGNDWSYTTGDTYRSASSVIHGLAEIVAKGGSLLLGVGPMSDGTLPPVVVNRLDEIGVWLNKNSKAIYATRITSMYNYEKTWFTQSKDGRTLYAISCLEENKPMPKVITWKGNEPKSGTQMILLETGKAVKWKKLSDGSIEVAIPTNLSNDIPALAFEFKPA